MNPLTGWDGVIQWKEPGVPWGVIFDGTPFMDVTQVLHWYTNDPEFYVPPLDEFGFTALTVGLPPNALDGFSFVADFSKTDAPYQTSWANLPMQTGDPAFRAGGSPASPLATAS